MGRPIPTAQLAVRMTTLELSGANKSRKPTSPEMAGARRAMGRRGGGGGGQTSRCTKPGAAAAPWRAEGEDSAAVWAPCGRREGGGGS